LIIVPFLSLTSGCATYKFGRLPSPYVYDHPSPITQKNVAVAVEFLNSNQANVTFDCELTKRTISPVFIVIDNKSNVAYGFRKADVDRNYIDAEQVAKKCYRNIWTRVIGYGFLGVFIILWIVFIPAAIFEATNCSRINAQMRNDYTTNEIADTTIGPGRSISGVMFISPLKSGEAFTIPLTNRETGEKILFQFLSNQPGPSEPISQEEKKPEEKKQQKQNFSPG
jgi:hypothetical protein